MKTFIKAKIKNQMNIDKNRVTANITEYHIISKLIFLTINVLKFMMMRELFNGKKCMENCEKWTYGLLSPNYPGATRSTFFLLHL